MAHRILLVDDDDVGLDVLSAMLEYRGYNVTTTTTGTKALQALETMDIAVAVSDLRLPDMSGLDVLRVVNQRARPIPVIIITGFGTTKDVIDAMHLGVYDFVEKPIFEDDLLMRIDRAVYKADLTSTVSEGQAIEPESHASSRWAAAVVPLIRCQKDPRTIAMWGRWIGSSPGAIRNWCHTAGITARRSLIFGRLLRAVVLRQRSAEAPQDLLDVVDTRTLDGLFRLAGFDNGELPADVDDFLQQQQLVKSAHALEKVRSALRTNHRF
jgi:CheY-like chemotaxis protein